MDGKGYIVFVFVVVVVVVLSFENLFFWELGIKNK